MPKVVFAAMLGIVTAAAGLGAMVVFSPYGPRAGFPYKLIYERTAIDAPCDSVFSYLGTSANARDWSVYVDHITPLNTGVAKDGARGSVRRSFKNADERGMTWDEFFSTVEPARRRQLMIFNVRGVPMRSAIPLMTEQIYDSLPGGCGIAFTLFYRRSPSVADELKMHFASYQIARIFRANIGNVKRLTEQRFGDRQLSGATEP